MSLLIFEKLIRQAANSVLRNQYKLPSLISFSTIFWKIVKKLVYFRQNYQICLLNFFQTIQNGFYQYDYLDLFTALALVIGAPVFSAAAYHNSSGINFELRVNIEELRQGCIKSPDIQLSSLFWTVQLCSTSNFVSISLVSHFERDAPKWSSEAQAIFKLISNDGDDNKTLKRNITKRLFDAYNHSHSVNFLSWDTIKDDYIHEGESIFDIEIAVDEPVRKHETEQISTKAIILVENVSKLSSYPYRSPSFMVRGIRWSFEFKKRLNNELVGFLHAERKDLSRSESWLVTATFDLLSWNTQVAFATLFLQCDYGFNHG